MRTSTVKAIAAIALTGAGSALVVGFQTSDPSVQASTTAAATSTTTAITTTTASGTTATTATNGTTSSAATTGTTTTATTGSSSATSAPEASATTTQVASATTYADGTWTGAAVAEPWGTFQVQAVISGGTVTDIVVVSSPQDDHSSRINSSAVPMLTQAAIASQSADLDMISGATWTSRSYATSLQAALDEAAAAAETAA